MSAAPMRKRALQVGIVAAAQALVFAWLVAFMRAERTGALLALIAGGAALCGLLAWRSREAALLYMAFRAAPRVAAAIALAMALAVPLAFHNSPYIIHIFVMAGIYAILALGLNFQLGSTGVVNLATAATYGIGAYTSAILSVRYGLPVWPGVLIGGSVAALFGLILGFPCMRTKDYYLSLVTIAFGLIIYLLLNNLSWTGGPNGIPNIPPLSIGSHSFKDPIQVPGLQLPFQANYYYLVMALLAFAMFVAYRLHHSGTGLTWNAIREDELAARCQGIDVTRYKILAFCIDAFFGGVCGTVYAHYIGFISPDNFHFAVSIIVVTMVIFGGLDNVAGVILGAFLLTVIPEKFRAFQDYRLVLNGAIVIALLVFRPQGLLPQKLRNYHG
jgi:branched-chain amino acid transport system permease protein